LEGGEGRDWDVEEKKEERAPSRLLVLFFGGKKGERMFLTERGRKRGGRAEKREESAALIPLLSRGKRKGKQRRPLGLPGEKKKGGGDLTEKSSFFASGNPDHRLDRWEKGGKGKTFSEGKKKKPGGPVSRLGKKRGFQRNLALCSEKEKRGVYP